MGRMSKTLSFFIFGLLVLAIVPSSVMQSYGQVLVPGDMYGSGASQSLNPGSIFLVSQTTGAQTFIGDPTLNGGLAGLTFDDQQRLWGSNNDPILQTSNLLEIDPITGSLINDVGPITLLGLVIKIQDLGFDPISDQLFGTADTGFLVTIDRITGIATSVGPLPAGNAHIGFSPAGTLFMVDRTSAGSLFTLDPTNANVLNVVPRVPTGELDALGVNNPIFVAGTTFQGLGSEIRIIDLLGNVVVVGSGVENVADLTFVPAAPPTPVGGTIIPVDTTALLLASVQSISMWMIPVVAAGIVIGVFVIKRRK